jgi:DNA-binding MarR family transcriptional regulator
MTEPDSTSAAGSAPLLSYLVGRLDRAIQQRLRQILEPFELTISQFTTLSVLRRRPGLSNAQLARRAFITAQSMHEVLATLEGRALVRRSADPAHGRVLATSLTDAGAELVERAEGATRAFEAELADVLGDERLFAAATAAIQRWAEYVQTVG